MECFGLGMNAKTESRRGVTAVNIVFALENEFDISIPDDDMKTIRSVADVIAGVERLVATKA